MNASRLSGEVLLGMASIIGSDLPGVIVITGARVRGNSGQSRFPLGYAAFEGCLR